MTLSPSVFFFFLRNPLAYSFFKKISEVHDFFFSESVIYFLVHKSVYIYSINFFFKEYLLH